MKKAIIIIITAILVTIGVQALANKSEANSKAKVKTWCQTNYWYADDAPKACEEYLKYSAIRFAETRHMLMHYPDITLYSNYLNAQAQRDITKVIEIEKKVYSDINQLNN